MKEIELNRVLASLPPDAVDQLCDLLLLKLADRQKGYLLPKQVVVGSNPITRSLCYNGGTCLSKMSVKTLLGKYRLFAEAQCFSPNTILHVNRATITKGWPSNIPDWLLELQN